jgi:hypothetical protein
MSAPVSAHERELADAVERLEAENAALRAQLTGPSEVGGRARGWRRRWLSVSFAVVGAVMLPVAVLTVWARDTLLDTDQYVDTVAPLADDPAVQAAVSSRVSDAIDEAVDFRAVAEEALPPEAAVLAGPIESGAKNLVSEAVGTIVASDQFKEAWVEANRVAQENVALVITGEGDKAVQTADGRVVLQLGPLVAQAAGRLDDALGTDLADAIPTDEIDAEFVLVESQDLADVQDAVRWFDALSWFSLVIALAALAATVVFAERRRLGARRLGIGVVVSMVVALLAYNWVRQRYLAALPEEVHSPDAAAAVFDILTRFVLRALRTLLVAGLLVLVGVWVTGPSTTAARVRAWTDQLVGRAGTAGEGRDLGPVPTWVAAHERALLIGVAVAGALTVVLWTRPTGMVVLLVVLAALAVAGLVRVLAAIGRRDQPRLDPTRETAGGHDAGTPPAAGPMPAD